METPCGLIEAWEAKIVVERSAAHDGLELQCRTCCQGRPACSHRPVASISVDPSHSPVPWLADWKCASQPPRSGRITGCMTTGRELVHARGCPNIGQLWGMTDCDSQDRTRQVRQWGSRAFFAWLERDSDLLDRVPGLLVVAADLAPAARCAPMPLIGRASFRAAANLCRAAACRQSPFMHHPRRLVGKGVAVHCLGRPQELQVERGSAPDYAHTPWRSTSTWTRGRLPPNPTGNAVRRSFSPGQPSLSQGLVGTRGGVGHWSQR